MVDKANMRDAAPHIERAHRCLEMLAHFAKNKERLSLQKRVPVYYDLLVESVVELQKILLTDNEYTERMGWSLARVSQDHEFSYSVTQNLKGDIFYSVDALLPLDEMKKNVLLTRRLPNGR